MTNRLTVPYEEIENRLLICCEFLMDRKKSIEDAYESLMENLGTKLVEFAEFEYWFKRFQNNLFDLGYDTSQDPKENSKIQNTGNNLEVIVKTEAPVNIQKNARFAIDEATEIAKKKAKIDNSVVAAVIKNEIADDYGCDIQNVPVIFQELINAKIDCISSIRLILGRDCSLHFSNIFNMHLARRNGDWTIICEGIEIVKIMDLESFIIDHLWFVLKNPNIKLNFLEFHASEELNSQKMSFEKHLQSMLQTINHQFQTKFLLCKGFNEDTFLSMVEHVKPGTLESILFDISWKKEGNHKKLKKIVETDQWKQAKRITSEGVIPSLKIEDVLHCELFVLNFDKIAPEYVFRVKELVINSTNIKSCILGCQDLDVNASRKVLVPNSLSERRSVVFGKLCITFTYKLPNSPNCLTVILDRSSVRFEKKAN